MKLKVKFAFLFSIMFCLLFLSTETSPSFPKPDIMRTLNAQSLTGSIIMINDTECTWHGDFIVNTSDTIFIENCHFTVENGMVYVYGTLYVENSTIWMLDAGHSVRTVAIYGNLTMKNSQVLKRSCLYCHTNSNVAILDSSTPTTRVTISPGDTNVVVRNSVLGGTIIYGGKTYLYNSTLSFSFFSSNTETFVSASDSNISRLAFQQVFDNDQLEIRPGVVGNLTIYSSFTLTNWTLVNTYVGSWNIIGGWGGPQSSIKYSNSIIDSLEIELYQDWSGNLSLTSGHTDHLELDCTTPPTIIENTTVKEWDIFIAGNSSILVSDSENVGIGLGESAKLTIVNSMITYLNPTLLYAETTEPFSGTIIASNTTIEAFDIALIDCALNVTLKEGFHDFFNIYVPDVGANMTLINSIVNSWEVDPDTNSNLNLSDSNLTKNSGAYAYYNLAVYDNASCCVSNSYLNSVFCGGWGNSSLTIVNSVVDTLYAYGGANITLINSTIHVMITDPVRVNQINSRIFLELDFSFEMASTDSIFSEFSDSFDPSLPPNIQRHSQYLNMTTTFDDYFESQVKIFYNATELQAINTSEGWLHMYYLNDSGSWQLCPIQSVDTAGKCVWANVTSLSCFTIGAPSLVGDINSDGKVDMKDVGYVARRFMCGRSDPLWDPAADIYNDGKIDMKDIGGTAKNFGKLSP